MKWKRNNNAAKKEGDRDEWVKKFSSNVSKTLRTSLQIFNLIQLHREKKEKERERERERERKVRKSRKEVELFTRYSSRKNVLISKGTFSNVNDRIDDVEQTDRLQIKIVSFLACTFGAVGFATVYLPYYSPQAAKRRESSATIQSHKNTAGSVWKNITDQREGKN